MCKNITLILNGNYVLTGYTFNKSRSEIQDIDGIKICDCSDKKSTQFFWGRLAAGTKATVGIGLKNGMGMTEGTEYME
jgi:hypothetical protein